MIKRHVIKRHVTEGRPGIRAGSPGLRRFAGAGLVLLAGLLTGLGCGSEPSDGPPERIILIVVDTLRRDHVSAYSPTVPTPNIDRLARGGRVFDNATSAFHSTTMSMAALFTGQTPSIESGSPEATLEWNTFASCGMSRFADSESVERCMPLALNTLAEDLRDAGYFTIGVVSNELLFKPYGYDQGFDDWVEVGRGRPGANLNAFVAARVRTAKHVNRLVAGALARRQGDRFFLYVHYIDVHDWLLFNISYEESVRRFDAALGELIDHLEGQGLLEDAAIVFTSDHGEILEDPPPRFRTIRHYGNPSFEPLLRVPLFVNPPIDLASDEFIRSQDLRGLIREIAGLEAAATPHLEPDELIVTEQFYQTYRKGRWKSMWQRGGSNVMLFDLAADSEELENLAESRPEILAAHRARIDALSGVLSTGRDGEQELGPEDIERLRALGYLDGPDAEQEARP